MSLRKFFRVGTKFFFFLFSGKTWLRTEATKVFWNIIHLKKNFFFLFLWFLAISFSTEKKSCLEKEYKTFRRKVFMLFFFLCQNFLTTSFQETECCFLISIVEKHVFPEKSPKKVQLTKHLFLTWVSRNIFHLKHFFLDFYFCFFVFFSSVKNFLPCGTKWRNSFLSTRFHPEYKENTISGENV